MEDKNVGGTETEEAKRLVTLPTGVVEAVPTPGGIVDRLPSAEEAGPGTSLLEDPSNVAALTKKERQVLKKKQLGDLPVLRDDVGAYGVLAEDDEEERGATSRTDSEMEDKAVGDAGGDGVGDMKGDGVDDTGGDAAGDAGGDGGGTWADVVASSSTETEDKAVGDTGGDGVGDKRGRSAGGTGGDGVGDTEGDGSGDTGGDDVGDTSGNGAGDTGEDAGPTWADIVAPPSTETEDNGGVGVGDTRGDGAGDTGRDGFGHDVGGTWPGEVASQSTETEETKRLVTLPTGVVEAVPTPGGIVDSLPSAEETGPGTSLGEDPFNVAALTKKERKVLKKKQLGDSLALRDDIGTYGVLAEDDDEQRGATSGTESETEGKAVDDTGGDGVDDGAGGTWADKVAPPSTETKEKGDGTGDTEGDGARDTGGDGAGETGGDGADDTWADMGAPPSTETEETKRLVTLPTGVVQAVPTPGGIVDRLPSAEETGPGTSLGEDPFNVAALTKKERKVLKQKQLGDLDALQDAIGGYGVLAEDDEEERGATSRTDSEMEDKAVGDTGGDGVGDTGGDGAGDTGEDGVGPTWADIVAPPSTETEDKGGDGVGDSGGDGAGETGGDGATWAGIAASPSTETEKTKRLVTLPTGVVQVVATPEGIVDSLPSAEETGPGTSMSMDPSNIMALSKKERKVLQQKQLGDLDALHDEIGGNGHKQG